MIEWLTSNIESDYPDLDHLLSLSRDLKTTFDLVTPCITHYESLFDDVI